jgi:protein YIPF5/7
MIPMMLDPEGSPVKNQSVFTGMQSNQLDDPWYSNSANQSPSSTDKSFDYNNMSMNYGNTGAMNNGGGSQFSTAVSSEEDYENEPPLLEELGINFDHIWAKTQAVLIPTRVSCFYFFLNLLLFILNFCSLVQQINAHILDDSDLAGPLCFCLLLGSCLLLSGKVRDSFMFLCLFFHGFFSYC